MLAPHPLWATSALPPWLATHWFPAALLALGPVLLAAFALLRGRRPGLGFSLALSAAALALLALGALLLPPSWAGWLLAGTALVLLGLLLALVLGGAWWRPPAWGVLGSGLFAAGGLWLLDVGEGLADAARAVADLRLKEPWWLALLALLPFLALLSWRRLTRAEVRPWVALGLRCTGVLLLAVALAEPFLAQATKNLTVLFVLDRSLSIPEEAGDDPQQPGAQTDLRWRRVRDFINEAVRLRGPGHERDRAGLVVFGRRPRLELPPSDAPRFNLGKEPLAAEDGNYTDIGAALKLALASFPADTGNRIVLISDGNENLGSAEEQARLAKSLGVQIDVLPLAPGASNVDEVLVERVDAPPVIEQGARVPIRVLVRSHNPNIVVGRLTLKQITDKAVVVVAERENVPLRLGLNPFSFDRPLSDEQRSYTYEAEFQPLRVVDEKGKLLQEGLPRDRVQNNRASTHVVARGRGRVLLLENEAGKHKEFVERLLGAGKGRFKVVAEAVDVLDNYKDRDKLAVFLSNFDCVILANVPADRVSEEHQEVIRANTHDQGCGLVMIGGPEGFGAGGWQNTPVEKALPVDSDIKALKVQGKGGLVLIMHASEMANGNMWQKKIGKLAVERLGPIDEVGVVVFDFGVGGCKWHVPMQEVGPNRGKILQKIAALVPGDMPDFDPALKMAHTALADPKKQFAARHVILISDGDPNCTMTLLPPMRADKITVTAVGVATHGANEDGKMAAIAKATKGRYYGPKTKPGTADPKNLPAIYIKETRLVSQSFVQKTPFTPVLVMRNGPTAKLPDLLPLKGFVRTTPKPSPLVQIPIMTPPFATQDFPILAHWHYGLGKAVAFTSDAGMPEFWSTQWAKGAGGREGIFAAFWEQVIGWSLRPTESGRLQMATEYRDGKIRVTLDARTADGKPDTKLKLRGGITAPAKGGPKQELRFVQKNSGVYEAEIKAEEAGSYFLNAQGVRQVPLLLRGLPVPEDGQQVTQKGRKLFLADGTEVSLRANALVSEDGKRHVPVKTQAEAIDGVRSGVTLPYSPEFADLESNTALLERLRDTTGGQSYADDADALAEAARSGALFRPVPERVRSSLPFHHWLLVVACGLLFLDVAVRRLAFSPDEVANKLAYVWARLRGLPLPPPLSTEIVGRLRGRPAQSPAMAGAGPVRAARRFEGTGGLEAPLGADAALARPTAAGPRPAPERGEGAPAAPEPAAGDLAERLLKAKKKVWEERKKDKG